MLSVPTMSSIVAANTTRPAPLMGCLLASLRLERRGWLAQHRDASPDWDEASSRARSGGLTRVRPTPESSGGGDAPAARRRHDCEMSDLAHLRVYRFDP